MELSTIVNSVYSQYDRMKQKGDDAMNYFQRLRDVRHDHDLTQTQVAELLHIRQSDYSKYERGVNMMGIDKYIVLAKFYNVSLDYLTGITNTPRTLDGSACSYITKQK